MSAHDVYHGRATKGDVVFGRFGGDPQEFGTAAREAAISANAMIAHAQRIINQIQLSGAVLADADDDLAARANAIRQMASEAISALGVAAEDLQDLAG
jgi:uncharacterized protein YgfB (UPF0149 family)